MQQQHLLVVAQLPLMEFYSYYLMAIYLFFLLFWFGINTVHKRLLEMIFLFLFRKKNLEADVCGVINGLDLGGAAMCVGGEAMDPQRGLTLSHGP